MTRVELDAILAKHNVKVDGMSPGAGSFADLSIGTGEETKVLLEVRNELKRTDPTIEINLTRVNNPWHSKYKQNFIEIKSFWNE